MMVAIRKNLTNFLAVIGLVLAAAAVSYYILQEQRLRIPLLEDRPFELKAEFETAQAVVPGQGQTIRVAGVRVGDVSDVFGDIRAVIYVSETTHLPMRTLIDMPISVAGQKITLHMDLVITGVNQPVSIPAVG